MESIDFEWLGKAVCTLTIVQLLSWLEPLDEGGKNKGWTYS
jgi:hypothetical protein